jgi:hypothetical protein
MDPSDRWLVLSATQLLLEQQLISSRTADQATLAGQYPPKYPE